MNYFIAKSRTVLRHTVAGNGWDELAFLASVDKAFGQPSAAAAQLFSLRAEALLNDPECCAFTIVRHSDRN